MTQCKTHLIVFSDAGGSDVPVHATEKGEGEGR